MSSALRKISHGFRSLDDWHHVNKFSLILVVLIFGAIPVTVFGALALRQLDPQAATGKPSNLSPISGTSIATTTPTFRWECYCYTTSYRVYVRESDGNFYAGTWYKDVSGTSADWANFKSANYKSFAGFQNSKRYYWAVGCTPGRGSCTTSGTANFTVDTTAPNAPYLTLNGVNTPYVNLSWTSAIDNVATVKYNVYRGLTGGALQIIGETKGTSYSDSSWEGKVSYTYAVKAFDAASNGSGYSNSITLNTPDRDFDLDGFSDSTERYIGTNIKSPCGSSAWPPDFDSNGWVVDADRLAMARALLNTVYNKRFDLDANGALSEEDKNIFNTYYGRRC